MENCILRFDIIPDDNSYDKFELPYYTFELDLGNIDPLKFNEDGLDNRKGYSIEECFKEAGVDVELLKSLQEFSRSDRQYIYFPPGNSIAHPFEQSDQAIHQEKRLSKTEYESLLKRALGSFQNGKAIIVGELNYVETNYKGHRFQRTNQLKHLVNLSRKNISEEISLTYTQDMGGSAPPSFEYSIDFAAQEDNYQAVLPEVSHSLAPGEADRFLVRLEVGRSSIHKFNVFLIYNNSKQLKSQDIKLELFRPIV